MNFSEMDPDNISLDLTKEEILLLVNEKFEESHRYLIDQLKNVKITCLTKNVTEKEMLDKQTKYFKSLRKTLKKDVPTDYPFPHSIDMDENLIMHLNQVLKENRKLEEGVLKDISQLESDIKNLMAKKNQIQELKENYKINQEVTNYKVLSENISREFGKTKTDLNNTVYRTFQEEDFDDFFGKIVRQYVTGKGEDRYIRVRGEDKHYIRFMLEADLIVYHPYDNHLIKLVDLLD